MSRPLSAPAPLIRVPEGTQIAVSVHNDLTHALRVFGLCEHGGNACAPLEVGSRRDAVAAVHERSARNLQLLGDTTGMPQQFRAADDTQLSGAFIVDPADPRRTTASWSSPSGPA